MDHELRHSLDLLSQKKGIQLTSTFGPQHGLRGEVQDNMVETEDSFDAQLGIPIFSLYGKVRRPTQKMLETFDVLLFDLQDIGCRIYTFATTLKYILEDCAKAGKEVWVLDRPNPVGRPIEGLALEPGCESFVGASPIPMRHGLTSGELALYYQNHFSLDTNLKVVKMSGYKTAQTQGFGWPAAEMAWVNPSPNIPTLNSARCFPGTVLIEGTTLSEGRGTTRALECVGAPDLSFDKVLTEMHRLEKRWLKGCVLRTCYFQPTFQKHAGKICAGVHIHAEGPHYQHAQFKPYRLVALMLKSIRNLYPDYLIWRDFPYEYENTRLAFDVICGGPRLREWVDDKSAKPSDLEGLLKKDEGQWAKQSKKFRIYS